MAGKKKKKEKKNKKASTGSLSHIGALLVPSAIFAAVPRTSTTPSLASTWPRSTGRSQSPIARALGEAGSLGTIVGDIHGSSEQPGNNSGEEYYDPESSPQTRSRSSTYNRPPARLPSEVQDEFEDSPSYESVETKSKDFDKTTKFFALKKDEKAGSAQAGTSREENEGEDGVQRDHFYHILDHERNQVVEPTYAKVDKKKNTSTVAPVDTRPTKEDAVADDDDSELSSSDDLTDVTSNDEESSISARIRKSPDPPSAGVGGWKKKSKRGSKKATKNREEETSEESSDKKKDSLFHLITDSKKNKSKSPREEASETSTDSSRPKSRKSQKRKVQETIIEQPGEMVEESQLEDSPSSHSNHPDVNNKSHRRGSKKSSLKRRAQVAPEGGALDETDTPSPPKADYPVDNGLDENQKKALKEIERLGFEGISQKVGLSDISEDEEAYTLPQAPISSVNNSYGRTDFEKRKAQFERDQFKESISESLASPQLMEGGGMLGDRSLESPEAYQRSLESLEQIRNSQTESLERLEQIRQANESSFLEQERHLERLISQQETVFLQQSEQQKEQQKLREELSQQQQRIQDQLFILEKIQHNQPPVGVSGDEVHLQKEMLEQQQQILHMQEQQQQQYEQQQDRLLGQQEGLCEQIRLLEHQQRQLQSNLSMLSPRDHDLAEIRQQEVQILSLLNEQKSHQRQYEQLHQKQQQRLEDQASIFHRDRLALEKQQQELLAKINEQENRSKQLEKELEGVSSKQNRNQKRRRDVPDTSESQELSDGPRVVRERPLEAVNGLDMVDAVPVRRRESPKSNPKSTTAKELYYLSKNRLELLESEKAALTQLTSSLQEENRALKQLATSLQKGSGGSSFVLQQQVKDLQQENKVFRDTVHRLNVELSRFQAKYRPVLFEEVEGIALPRSSEAAPWLVNSRFLAPLFLAYDDRLKEKEAIIKTYDEELNSFKGRVKEVVKENQELHMRLNKSQPDALELDEWQQLQEQAKLVVEENGLLMEQQEIQERKMKDMQRLHGQEVSKLSRRISKLESEKRRLETDMEDRNRNYTNLVRKYEAVAVENQEKIAIQDHLAAMDECRSVLEDLKVKKNTEDEEMKLQNEAVQKEKKNIAVDLADAKARVSQLERELDAYKKSQRKSERKSLFLERKLEHIQEREITAQETLTQVLLVAERTAEERDNYEHFAKTQKFEQKKAASMIRQGDINIMSLQEKLKESKKKSTRKVASATGRLEEKDKEINTIKDHYEQEINNLRSLLRDKQKQVETLQGERRHVDEELDRVWQEADEDNKHMKETMQDRSQRRQSYENS